MAGHSKWANIQHRKGRQDEKRGAAFSKIAKEITVAAKHGRRRHQLQPAPARGGGQGQGGEHAQGQDRYRASRRVPASWKASTTLRSATKGYGIGGAAIMVDCLTDNKTRTVAEVRHAFSKYGGNMGTDGCVAFQFKHCGQLLFAPGTDEGALMDAAIEAGADDVMTNDDGSIEVITAPTEFIAVKDALEAAGFKPEFAEVTMKPEGENVFAGDDAAQDAEAARRAGKPGRRAGNLHHRRYRRVAVGGSLAIRRGSRHFDCFLHQLRIAREIPPSFSPPCSLPA